MLLIDWKCRTVEEDDDGEDEPSFFVTGELGRLVLFVCFFERLSDDSLEAILFTFCHPSLILLVTVINLAIRLLVITASTALCRGKSLISYKVLLQHKVAILP